VTTPRSSFASPLKTVATFPMHANVQNATFSLSSSCRTLTAGST
jgi:hypothetical protein